ncbi:MAG: biotin--[acetyl-CoA-carboxylase] ligase [Kordiimonas sp.]|nr:biotin--[acetyl-CoA-carboxylase] ligase [Kordiimonas sp.]|tara:strand:+ start:8642 stop:9430 length:789 start_codon:yes stop_codon:yes gene_type:complete
MANVPIEKNIKMPEGYILQAFSRLDSTNQEAYRQAEAGAISHQWIMAAEQTSGRGRRGREWVSQTGNLYCSLMLRLPYGLQKTSELSFVTALAVADTVRALLPKEVEVPVHCKWPNDVLISGEKVAGILMETAATVDVPAWVVIGIGINLKSFPADTPFPATAIRVHSQIEPARSYAMEVLAHNMDGWIGKWQTMGFNVIRRAWLSRAAGLGEEITVRLPTETLKGCFVELDPDGALVLQMLSGRRKITAGDIFFSAKNKQA